MAVRQTNQELITLDRRYGGNDVYRLATRAFRSAHRKLGSGAYAHAIERDLEAAVGETGEVAAWIAYDADQLDASRQITHEAMFLSRSAGDRGLELFELSHLALLALQIRRSREALRIAQDITAGVGMSPRVCAMFELRRGRALAQLAARTPALAASGHSVTRRFRRSRRLPRSRIGGVLVQRRDGWVPFFQIAGA